MKTAKEKPVKTPRIPAPILAVLGKPVKTERYNTCNAWGFGGVYGGTVTTFENPDIAWITGRISTRHQGTFAMENHIKINGMYFSNEDFLAASKSGAKTAHDFFNHRYPETK